MTCTYSATVRWILNDFISFDFGNFSVVVFRETPDAPHRIRVYRNSDHRDVFLSWCVREKWVPESVPIFRLDAIGMIDHNAAVLCHDPQNILACDWILDLLERHFPEHMALYGYGCSGKAEPKPQEKFHGTR